MIRLKILNSYYRVVDGYDINESSREVKFSSLKIEFTDKTITDLPLKYQEVQLVDIDNEYNIKRKIYTGYVNNFVLPNMKNNHEYRELEIDLLSPLAMATIRTVDAVGTYNLQPLLKELIQPLIDDGFVLKEFNVTNNQITVNYLNETVESSLNKLSNKHNFWWYIDENKNIYINSISYLMNLQPKLIYDDNNKINGLYNLIPSIDASDYCNVVNFTNVRMYAESTYKIIRNNDKILDIVSSYPLFTNTTLKKGDKVEFINPFDISENACKKMKSIITNNVVDYPLKILWTDGIQFGLTISYNEISGKVNIPFMVTIADDYNDSNTWVLVRDAFFKNLIVGLQYNGDDTINIDSVSSFTALVWAKVKIEDNMEINRNRGIISDTGIVEKQIDMNEQWKTLVELTDIANSYIKVNNSKVDEVKLGVDENININIGDTIRINKDAFLINDLYIVTDKKYIFDDNYETWEYTLKNTNVLENYVDLFRAGEQQTNERTYNLITSNHIIEGFNEVYEVIVNES